MKPVKATQLSFLSDTKSVRGSVVNARIALNVLARLLENVSSISEQGAVYFKAIFSPVAQAAELGHGLPVSKTTLRPLLQNPLAAITLHPPSRPDEFAQMETLIDFVQRRLSSAAEKTRLDEELALLLGPANPELLITQDGIASRLYGTDREEAARLFRPVLGPESTDTAEALIEAFVLLRANHADVHTGIARLFWRDSISSAEVQHFIEGCADGKTRAYFSSLLTLSEERQRAIFSTISLESFYAAFGERDATKN